MNVKKTTCFNKRSMKINTTQKTTQGTEANNEKMKL